MTNINRSSNGPESNKWLSLALGRAPCSAQMAELYSDPVKWRGTNGAVDVSTLVFRIEFIIQPPPPPPIGSVFI